MNAPRIAVLILTRGRPAGLVAAVQAFHALASGDVPVSYVICCDDDDDTLETSLPLLTGLPVIVSRNPRPDALGAAWNRGAVQAIALGKFDWDMALFTGDDTIPLAMHWDRTMAALGHLPAFAWQELNDPDNVTYPVVNRRWFNSQGGRIMPELFPYWFNDTWLSEVHMMAFGAPLPVIPGLPMGGRRGTTREMREVGFWFDAFAATRPRRLTEAYGLAAAFGQSPPRAPHLAAYFAAWDTEQQGRVPHYNVAFGADQVPPTPRYRRLRAHAETLLPRPAFDLDAAARRKRNPLPRVPFMMPGASRLSHMQGHTLPPVCETEGVSQ